MTWHRAHDLDCKTPPRHCVIANGLEIQPIPDRRLDWTAHYEGFEEGPYGTGRAAQEAIADFVDNYEAPLTALVA